jgi:hypothetical protein
VLIWKFEDQKVNGFGTTHIVKSHFKGIVVCIFRQSLMKYGGNKSIKENSLRPWVLIPEDNRHSTVTRKDSIVLRRAHHHLLHALLSSYNYMYNNKINTSSEIKLRLLVANCVQLTCNI